MSTDAVLFVAASIVLFAIFAVTLAVAGHRTG